MEKDKILNLVAFVILMEYREGILGKHPSYMIEKYERYVENGMKGSWKGGLDDNNTRKMLEYIQKWYGSDALEDLFTEGEMETIKKYYLK